jgi:hypothetical protein
MKRIILASAVLTITGLLSISARAQGGPPMLTDDPGTPGNKNWEVNVFATFERSRDLRVSEAPNLDINYGLGDHIQLKFEVPWLVMKEYGRQARNGLGDSLAGVKWRFMDEDRHGIDLSTYPQIEFNNPTRSAARGLVDQGVKFFLPVEVVKSVWHTEVNGEVGYEIAKNATDELVYGVAIGGQVTKRIEMIGELHGSVLRTLKENELFLNLGSRLKISKHHVLLLSAGRSIKSPAGTGSQYIAAFGVQFKY